MTIAIEPRPCPTCWSTSCLAGKGSPYRHRWEDGPMAAAHARWKDHRTPPAGPDEAASQHVGPQLLSVTEPLSVTVASVTEASSCERELALTEFNGRQLSCRDCAAKVRRARAAEKPGAKVAKVRKPLVEYTPAMGRQVCDLIAEGETLTDICNMPGFPAVRDIARWRTEVDEFAQSFAIARDVRADIRVDGIAKAVKEMRKGELGHAVGKAVVDGLKWLAGKDSPRYADKVTIDQTIRPGAPEPESEDLTKAWIARAIAGAPAGGNVIKLVPQRSRDDEEETDAVRDA